MTEGIKLYVTVKYAFNYELTLWDHLVQFDILTQFFEKRNNLQGFISDEEGDRIEENSEVAILVDCLYDSFRTKNVYEVVEQLLLDYEMYEILAEFTSELCEKAKTYKQQLLKVRQDEN